MPTYAQLRELIHNFDYLGQVKQFSKYCVRFKNSNISKYINLCWLPAPGDDITRSVMEEIVTDPTFYTDETGFYALHDFTNTVTNMTCALPGK